MKQIIKIKLPIALIISTAILLSPIAAASGPTDTKLIKFENNCSHGLNKQPNGPMAIINFCEDALGTYIALLYYDPMGAPSPTRFFKEVSKEEQEHYYEVWSLDNRMWQEQIWGSDVTSYAWHPNGTKLFVATSNIYGSGSLYELDLLRKKYKQIAPEDKKHSIDNPGPGFLITGTTTEVLSYQLLPWDLPEGADVKETKYSMK
jgi:hypothetical protein